MSRRKKKSREPGVPLGPPVILIVIIALFFIARYPVQTLIVSAVTVSAVISFYLYSRYKKATRLRALRLADVDNMSGIAFEQYVAKLLEGRGFNTTITKGSGDLGVDIIASKDEVKYAIQVKRQSKGVSRRAVSDAVAGKEYYRADKAMVVTNNHFTQGAHELARLTECELVDRDTLAEWIREFQARHGVHRVSTYAHRHN